MAAFSKKHYEILAQTLKSAGMVLIATATPDAVPATLHTLEVIKSRIISMLIRDNSRFNPERFADAADPSKR